MAEVYAFINSPTMVYIFAGTMALIAIGRLVAFVGERRAQLLLTSIVSLGGALIGFSSMSLTPMLIAIGVNWLLTAFLNRNL